MLSFNKVTHFCAQHEGFIVCVYYGWFSKRAGALGGTVGVCIVHNKNEPPPFASGGPCSFYQPLPAAMCIFNHAPSLTLALTWCKSTSTGKAGHTDCCYSGESLLGRQGPPTQGGCGEKRRDASSWSFTCTRYGNEVLFI